MKKRILILEDQEARQLIFRELFKDNFVIIMETARDCIEVLRRFDWDVLFLDHDLGVDGTGYEVACWLEMLPERQPWRIFLHTGNPVGKAKMKQALPEAIEIDFKDLKRLEDLLKESK